MDWTMVAGLAEAAAAIIAAIAIFLTVRISRRQMLLEQRQLLIPLWGHLQNLNNIDPAKPVWLDVVHAVNLLELIAVCWEGQLIDENIIRRMYRSLYLEFYHKISECRNPPETVGKSGQEMLLACPSVIRLHGQLMQEHVERDQLKPIK